MIEFYDKRSEDEDVKIEKKKLDIGLVLENIDNANYDFFDSLSDDDKKQFAPYVVMRFMSSLDDSISVTYNAKKVEAVFGKWTSGGKEALNELKDEINGQFLLCSRISKYEHAKYDWRIQFSVKDMEAANTIIAALSEFNITGSEIVSLTSQEEYKNYIIFLNTLVNEGFWDIQNHPELQYQLMCSVSTIVGTKQRKRSWLNFSEGIKSVDNDILGVLKNTVDDATASQLNMAEYKILLNSYTNETFKTLLHEIGYQESEVKHFMDKFKKETKKYATQKK